MEQRAQGPAIPAARIARHPPRDRELLTQINVGFMLGVWAFLYWLLIISGALLLPLVVSVVGKLVSGQQPHPGLYGPCGAAVGQIALGLWLRRRARRIRATRERVLLEGVLCPARLVRVRPAIGFKITFMQFDCLHVFEVQRPDTGVFEHRVKLPLNHQERLGGRIDLLALVHLDSGATLVPETLHPNIEWEAD